MIKVPYADSDGQLSVTVKLKNAADVFLVDSNNYRKMQNGQKFNYFGGHYKYNPVVITVNGIGRWYLIVNGSNYNYAWK